MAKKNAATELIEKVRDEVKESIAEVLEDVLREACADMMWEHIFGEEVEAETKKYAALKKRFGAQLPAVVMELFAQAVIAGDIQVGYRRYKTQERNDEPKLRLFEHSLTDGAWSAYTADDGLVDLEVSLPEE